MRVRVRRAAVALAGLSVVATAGAAGASGSSGSTSSATVGEQRTQPNVMIRTSTADTTVQINVDIGLKTAHGCRSRVTGACKGSVYHPCFNTHDPLYAGCQLYTFYRVLHTDNQLVNGIKVGSTETSRSGKPVATGWGRKVTEAHLEVYAADPAGQYGDTRLKVSEFPLALGDTAYSKDIGHLNLAELGDLDAGFVQGHATRAGRPMAARSFKLDLFGHTNTGHATGSLLQGSQTEYGFGRAGVAAGRRDGLFRSRALWKGAYDVHVQRKGESYLCGLTVKPGANDFTIDFAKPGLGRGCQPMDALPLGVPG